MLQVEFVQVYPDSLVLNKMVFERMKKLLLTLILTSYTVVSFSQENSPSEDHTQAFLETHIGLVSYNYFDVMAPSIEFNLGTALGKYFHLGVFAGGYAAIASAEGEDVLGRTYQYNPKGLRAGMMLRVSTNPAKSHFYGELTGSVGKAFDTGLYSDGEHSNAAEYLVGTNIGVNLLSKDGDMWGVYTGLNLGQLDFDHSGKEGGIARFHFGLTYHKKM